MVSANPGAVQFALPAARSGCSFPGEESAELAAARQVSMIISRVLLMTDATGAFSKS